MAARRRRKQPAQRAYDDEFDIMKAHERFLDLVADGISEVSAAFEVGWTPKQMHTMLQDRSYLELVIAARDRAVGTIEQVVFDKAKEGSPWAVKMFLENRAPERWQNSSTQRIEVKTSSAGNAEMIGAVKESIMAVLASVGPKQLQALPAVIEATAWEEDDDSPADSD